MTLHPPSPCGHSASLPVYQAHALRNDARHHILVCVGLPDASDLRFLAELPQRVPHQHYCLMLEDDGDGNLPPAQTARLMPLLSEARTGWHLYLSGPEAGLWPLYVQAIQAGMQPQEISLHRHDSAMRPIYCVHCGTRQLAASQAPQPICGCCGVALEIRDHFSRVQGAYLGVVANADQPYARAST